MDDERAQWAVWSAYVGFSDVAWEAGEEESLFGEDASTFWSIGMDGDDSEWTMRVDELKRAFDPLSLLTLALSLSLLNNLLTKEG